MRLRGEHRRRRRHPRSRCRTRSSRQECDELGHHAAGAAASTASAWSSCRRTPTSRRRCEELFEQIVREEGQRCSAGATCRPTTAHSARPRKRRRAGHAPGLHRPRPDVGRGRRLAFERKLYVIRRRVENAVRASGDRRHGAMFYIPSLSCKTLVYKGMLIAPQLDALLPRPRRPARSSPRWRWCTRASAPTPSRAGSARTRTATSATTARSTRCAATSTGCTPARACSRPTLFGDDLEEAPAGHRPGRQRLGHVRQLPGAAGARRPLAAARDDDDDPRAVERTTSP